MEKLSMNGINLYTEISVKGNFFYLRKKFLKGEFSMNEFFFHS